MKKKYFKPEILFEDFTLSTSVASCATHSMEKVANSNKECGFYDEYLKVVVVTNDINGCAFSEAEGYRVAKTPGENDGVCYHVPIEAFNVWNS